MRVLVTGSAGFIGAEIVRQLLEQGHGVRCLDNARTCAQDVDIITGDITDPEVCHAACHGMDAALHGAAIHHIETVASGPLRVLDVNVAGTLNMLRSAAACGVGRFVYLSSAKIYGEPETLPSLESDWPKPSEIYALSKVTGEHYCRLFHEREHMDIVIIRPFSVYGPRQSLNTGYIGMLLDALLHQKPLCFPGRADFVRDFVHVADVARLSMLAVTENLPGLTTLNSGSGMACSLAGLVEVIQNITGKPIAAGYSSARPETITRTQASMELARTILGYSAQISLADGLEQTLAWFQTAAGN